MIVACIFSLLFLFLSFIGLMARLYEIVVEQGENFGVFMLCTLFLISLTGLPAYVIYKYLLTLI